jgi:hypothetical protein
MLNPLLSVGDEVQLVCQFSKGSRGIITRIDLQIPQCYRQIRVKRVGESGDGLWFSANELKLLNKRQETTQMFEVGKKYKNGRGDIKECLYVNDRGAVLRSSTTDEWYDKQYAQYWKEYVEPKVIEQVQYVLTSTGEIIIDEHPELPHGWTRIGTIRVTHTEGQGLAVEVIG